MTTALATQLARLRTQAGNSLDLKTQKRNHAQSLLFDSNNAAQQDFEVIYHFCYDGFEELCQLDSSFSPYSRTLFSPQSAFEDRFQLTAAANKQLDVVLENFLSLASSKLLLRPALKAIEWLVRRFR